MGDSAGGARGVCTSGAATVTGAMGASCGTRMGRNPVAVGTGGVGGGAGGLETGAWDQALAEATSHTKMQVLKSFILNP